MPSFVGYVPTTHEDIDILYNMVPVSPSDVVYDLGSGDGRLLFAALKRGAGRAVGIELNAERIQEAREAASNKNLEDRVTFIEADFMDVNLTDASVVLCYLCSAASAALKPKLETELEPGTRVVMETFPVPGWIPNQTSSGGFVFCNWYTEFYLYVMPPTISEQQQ